MSYRTLAPLLRPKRKHSAGLFLGGLGVDYSDLLFCESSNAHAAASGKHKLQALAAWLMRSGARTTEAMSGTAATIVMTTGGGDRAASATPDRGARATRGAARDRGGDMWSASCPSFDSMSAPRHTFAFQGVPCYSHHSVTRVSPAPCSAHGFTASHSSRQRTHTVAFTPHRSCPCLIPRVTHIPHATHP